MLNIFAQSLLTATGNRVHRDDEIRKPRPRRVWRRKGAASPARTQAPR
ncbi:MAG: hypothetical protein KDK02_03855 [Rhodobacteraceae bacterium]|nr:hypothetical protein [Paracoccaceae bacterium]